MPCIRCALVSDKGVQRVQVHTLPGARARLGH